MLKNDVLYGKSNWHFSETNMSMISSSVTEKSRFLLRTANKFNLVSDVEFFKYFLVRISEENVIFGSQGITEYNKDVQ